VRFAGERLFDTILSDTADVPLKVLMAELAAVKDLVMPHVILIVWVP
jgi:hypothetical protein